MNTIVKRLDGTTYDFDAIGITTRDFVVSSPKPRHFTEVVDSRNGQIDMGTVFDARPITGSYYLKATDLDDYALMRDEVFRLLRSDEPFYVIDSRNPSKRWFVKVADSFDLDQQRVYGFFDVNFTAYSGVAESVGTTLDPFTFDAELWQIGQGLPADVDLLYAHSTTAFRVYNAGDIAVNPRNMPLVITYTGASTNLTITNTTTSDKWAHSGASNSGDVIRLDGVRATKNGLSVFRDTNRKLISLAPGWNDFVITGASNPFEIAFDFRYYYL